MSAWTVTFKPPGSDKEQSFQVESISVPGASRKLNHSWKLDEPVIVCAPYTSNESIYALTTCRNEKGHYRVQAYMWNKDKTDTRWFIFRSARHAHQFMKRHARKRRWSDL